MKSWLTSKLNRRHIWLLAIIILALLRLYIVAQDDFAPVATDSRNYAQQSEYYLESSTFAHLPRQSPGLPIVIRASQQLGIPFKVFQDLLLILTAFAAAYMVKQITGSGLIATVLFATLAFCSWFFQSATLLMSEPLTAMLLLGLFLSSFHFIFVPVRRWRFRMALAAGAISGLFILTRSETPLLFAFWVMVAVCVFFVRRKKRKDQGEAFWKRVPPKAALICLPFVVALATTKYVESLHLKHYGVQSLTATEASGFKDLMNSLYSIPPEEQIRFAPVTVQSMTAACDVSPTLDSVRGKLLDKNAPAFESAKRTLDLDNQFGTALNWHVIRAFGGINSKSNQKMHEAAAEIRQAQSDGKLEKRFGRFPIDPLWNEWISEVPVETWKRISASCNPGNTDRSQNAFFKSRLLENEVELGFFEEGLLERTGAGQQSTIRIFASTSSTGFRRARLYSRSEQLLEETRVRQAANGKSEIGFKFETYEALGDLYPLRVELLRNQDESIEAKRFTLEKNDQRKRANFKISGSQREFWNVMSTHHEPVSGPRADLRSKAVSFSWLLVPIGMLLSLLVGLVRGSSPTRVRKTMLFSTLGIGFLILRSLFYALVEVWLNWGDFRYVEPNILFGSVAFFCLAFAIGALLNQRIKFLRTNRFSRCR